ncbi:MAG: acyl carrier protein [Clostridiales bacterium]|nr:acyl carrier protein [Clostridiales bacterium]
MIYEKLLDLITEQFGVDGDTITEETSFMEDLNADSLDLVELMMSIEEEFDLGEIEDDSLDKIKTVGDAVKFVKDRIES